MTDEKEKSGFYGGLHGLGKRVALGGQIGSAKYASDRIVGAFKSYVDGKKIPRKYRYLKQAVFETKVGQKALGVVIPGAVYLLAKTYPDKVPKSDSVAKVAGYAVIGTASEAAQELLRHVAPAMEQIATIASDVMPQIKQAEGENVFTNIMSSEKEKTEE